MRLINVNTLGLEEYFEQDIPPYAILSHRWGATSDELSYQEVAKSQIDETKAGFSKLLRACEIASQHHVKYLWIDTCCIDKRSSAELSEAINSMYQWYERSQICLAYLEDVERGPEQEELFRKSVWFTRSWTLQELLAPRTVDFYDCFWRRIYDKDSEAELLQEITRVPVNALTGWNDPSVYLVAERLSWASKRTATRTEDIAYSLMGIFDVNMPPLYGEGMKSFGRLLEEIARGSTDPSFLYWMSGARPRRLLASRPANFAAVFESRVPMAPIDIPFSLSNIGLEIEGDLIRWSPDTYALLLSGQHPGNPKNSSWGLIVRKSHGRRKFMYKVSISEFDTAGVSMRRTRRVTILKEMKPIDEQHIPPDSFRFDIQIGDSVKASPLTIERGTPWSMTWKSWTITQNNRSIACIFDAPRHNAVAKMTCSMGNSSEFLIELSFDFDCRPCALIYPAGHTNIVNPVWKISDAITKLDEAICDATHSMTEIGSIFLRSQGSRYVCAEIQGGLIPEGIPAWVAIIPPRDSLHGNSSEYWKVLISATNPF